MKTTDGTDHDLNSADDDVPAADGNYQRQRSGDKLEFPLPFGYNMDLDFLRFCSDSSNDLGPAKPRYLRRRRGRRRSKRPGETAGVQAQRIDLESLDDALKDALAVERSESETMGEERQPARLLRQLSNSSVSSISTVSSAFQAQAGAGDAHLLPSVEASSEISSTSTLRGVREQMAASLAKLKECEREVERIPAMLAKVAVLKEEKRLLLLRLKQRELANTGKEGGGVTDPWQLAVLPVPRTDRGTNTDATGPEAPTVPSVCYCGVSPAKVRTVSRGTATLVEMGDVFSRARTEKDKAMSCSQLRRAMAKVEKEDIRAPGKQDEGESDKTKDGAACITTGGSVEVSMQSKQTDAGDVLKNTVPSQSCVCPKILTRTQGTTMTLEAVKMKVGAAPAVKPVVTSSSPVLLGEDQHQRSLFRQNDFKRLMLDSSAPSCAGSRKLSQEVQFAPTREKKEEEREKEIGETLVGEDKEFIKIFGAVLHGPISCNPRKKAGPSREMKAALKVLNGTIGRAGAGTPGAIRNNAQVTNAVNIVQREWFRITSAKRSSPQEVEDYLDAIGTMGDKGADLLGWVVNLADVSGNTALHYSVWHGNFDLVSVLLDSKVADPDVRNKAGYTCVMLVGVAELASESHRSVTARLCRLGDVESRGGGGRTTALMLAASRGSLEAVEVLVARADADPNARDGEGGSTALMCAAGHGRADVVRFLLRQPEVDPSARDGEGLTAMEVALEAGHKDVAVMLYAADRTPSSSSSKEGAKSRPSARTSGPSISTGGKTSSPYGSGQSPPLLSVR